MARRPRPRRHDTQTQEGHNNEVQPLCITLPPSQFKDKKMNLHDRKYNTNIFLIDYTLHNININKLLSYMLYNIIKTFLSLIVHYTTIT